MREIIIAISILVGKSEGYDRRGYPWANGWVNLKEMQHTAYWRDLVNVITYFFRSINCEKFLAHWANFTFVRSKAWYPVVGAPWQTKRGDISFIHSFANGSTALCWTLASSSIS
jgi:hypothetical protein